MKPTSQRRRITSRFALSLGAMALLGWSSDASALPCIEDKFGSTVNCTANDISITDITDIVVTDDGCASINDTVTFNATLTVVTTATSRYDIGLFIGQDGVQAENGECSVYSLPTSPKPPFVDLDSDGCGDSQSSVELEVPVTSVTVDCVDANGDSKLDVASCTSWQQNSGEVCGGAADCEPGTASKCNCPETPTDIDIFVPPVCDTDAECDELATGCFVGTCDPEDPNASDFGCVFTPDDSLCDDDQFCNGVETCDDDGVCVDGTAPDCSDDFACTVDTCNETTDTCVNTPDNTACDDDQFCNGVETCSATLGCVAGTAPDCSDDFACTADSCNETTDSCVNAPNDAACNDGQFCNGVETCSAAVGCVAGTAPNCADALACTIDSCNETTDSCDHAENNSACNDGLFCNGVETCDDTAGCVAGTAPNCADAHACTIDTCNETTDSCDHAENDAACNDSLFCNGVETCDAATGCVAGTAPNCADAHACTIDSCNETTDSCDHAENDAACNDSQFCNGVETCDASAGCVAGTAPNCNDGVTCTLDTCNETTDACDHDADDTVCNDALFCNGVEICDPTAGCTAGSAPACGDAIECSLDTCSEALDSCVSEPDDALCDDGNECTLDTCSLEGGCDHVDICPEGICRSPGFWSTHGDITQDVLDAVGGLEVCGQSVTTTDVGDLSSALEGLCVTTEGVHQRSLYRQLVAAALNCAMSNAADCDALIDGFDACNAVCAGEDAGEDAPTTGECTALLDCFNNGGTVVDGQCATGTCSVTEEYCGGDFGECELVDDVPQDCEPVPGNCHDAEFCQEAIDVCPETTGRATSSRLCRTARQNDCTIDDCED